MLQCLDVFFFLNKQTTSSGHGWNVVDIAAM